MGVYRKIQIACLHCGKNVTNFCKHDGSRKRKGDFYIDYKVSGKRVWESIGSSYNLAKKILVKRQVEIAEDRFLDKKIVTAIPFKKAMAEYLERVKTSKKPNSAKRDKAEDTKNGEPRNVPMDENLVAMLSSLPRAFHHNRVFTYKGNPIGSIKRAFITACKRANLSNLVFHDLRHTATTNLRRRGVKVETAMAVVGHKSIAMFKRYRKLGESERRMTWMKQEQQCGK